MTALRAAVATLASATTAFTLHVAAAQGLAQQAGSAGWNGFQIIMWQEKTPAQYTALTKLGVTAAKVPADRAGEKPAGIAAKVAPIVRARLNSYVENIATDFYAAYHRWFPHQQVNWKFLAAKRQLTADPTSLQPFIRQPSLSDPKALARISVRLRQSVSAYAAFRPLFFNLADEAGIADLTAFWDFDLSSSSLDGFRSWLKQQYPSLADLNREWSTDYTRWAEVMPQTTTEAMRRNNGNYARWSDFKAWMDVAFARAIRRGAAAVHQAAPSARAALEGVQIPGWGGYDYSLLAGSVDVMEMSTDDVAIEIMHSLDPSAILLSTSTLAGPREEHEVWQRVLLGTRGLVLWDEGNELVHADGSPGPRAAAARATFAALRNGVGKALAAGRSYYDPIAILYSPASFRVQWMLDHRAAGASWTERQADTEDEDNAVRVATRAALHGLEQQGFQPRFLTDAQLESGALGSMGIHVLILPETLALGKKAAAAIAKFIARGGRVAIIGQADLFDSHGRRLNHSPLASAPAAQPENIVSIPLDDHAALHEALAAMMMHTRLKPLASVPPQDAAYIRVYARRNASSTILSLQADLGPDGTTVARDTVLRLSRIAYAYDVTDHRALGQVDEIRIKVGSVIPTVIVLRDTSSLPLFGGAQ